MNRLIAVALFAVLFSAGCDNKPGDTAKNVSDAREDASQEIKDARQDAAKMESEASEEVHEAQSDYAETDADAREELSEVESDAMITTAKADYEVAMADADGRYAVAKEKCGALTGVDNKACLSTAESSFIADKAAITADRDSALVLAERHN
jgi:vacuolar-type H+-ATPase subunit H